MSLHNGLYCICTLVGLFMPTLSAGPAVRESIKTLASGADAIVAGSVETTEVNGTVGAIIHVDRVLKGSVLKGSAISVTWTRPENPVAFGKGGASTSRGYGVFFLKQNATGSWSILSVTNGDISWDDTYIPTPQSVPAALKDVAFASLTPKSNALDNVLVELVIATEAGAPVPFDLVDGFRESRSPVLAAAFSRFLSKQDPRLFSIGLRGSILSGDPSSILTVRQKYAKLSSSDAWIPLLDEIKIYYLNTAPQAVETLGQIATDNTVAMDLRIAIAGALARMHTQQSLSYLAQLLSDQNSALKAMGVGGLSSFANNIPIGDHEPAPGPWTYRTEDTIAHSVFDESAVSQRESYFIGFWKDWWNANQVKLSH